MVELVVLVKGYSSYKFYVFWFKILCEDTILYRGGGFLGDIRSFISFLWKDGFLYFCYDDWCKRIKLCVI